MTATLGGGVVREDRADHRGLRALDVVEQVAAEDLEPQAIVGAVPDDAAVDGRQRRAIGEARVDRRRLAVRAAKEAALRGLAEESVAAALRQQESYPAVAALRASPDAKEGAAAFTAKRPPQWSKG